MSKTATFTIKKETKGTFMFEELDLNGQPTIDMMGTAYVCKSMFEGKRPKSINVTITATY